MFVLPDIGDFDLDAYLGRVGYTGALEPTLENLTGLMCAHLSRVPQENLDRLFGVREKFDVASIQRKMVASRRGGGCIGHTLLFKAVLDRLGFRNQMILARFRMRHVPVEQADGQVVLTAQSVPFIVPHGHAALVVEIEGRKYLVDVGLGPFGPLGPIALVEAVDETPVNRRQYRMRRDREMFWVLQGAQGEEWVDFYSFTMEEYYTTDLEYVDHFLETFPRMAPFRSILRATTLSPDYRASIMGSRLYERTAESSTCTEIVDRAQLSDILQRIFGIPVEEDQLSAWQPEPAA